MSTTAEQPLAEHEQPWENKLELIKRTVASGASKDDLDLLLHHARKAGLDPLARQIYFVKRGRGTIQVGIDGLRLVADRTGLYAGNDDAVFESTPDGTPSKATVTVYKVVQGLRCPFTATARWQEYYPGDDQGFQWRKMPHVMLAKCAEALALRKAFPMEMSGLYVQEEMEQADSAATQDRNAELHSEVEAEARTAFGYSPGRWPTAKMFGSPVTPSQVKMLSVKAKERGIATEHLPFVRSLVLKAYGVADSNSKANASLIIDWLMNAGQQSIDAALTAAQEYETAA